MRKWGRWVSEIREPGKKTRIWLGSYESAEMAAAAYDVAALHFRGCGSHLNFPELAGTFPTPSSSNARDIQVAAQKGAALMFEWRQSGGVGSQVESRVPVTIGLSPSQIQAINEAPMDSPKMWMVELLGASGSGGGLFFEEPQALVSDMEWDEQLNYYNGSIWD